MGMRYRKSINIGPLRINFSRSGIGYSVGGKCFRVAKKANGGYRATASIPGTGVSCSQDIPEDAAPSPKSPRPALIGGVIAAAALLVIGCASTVDDPAPQDEPDPAPIVEQVQDEQPTDPVEPQEDSAQPEPEPEPETRTRAGDPERP